MTRDEIEHELASAILAARRARVTSNKFAEAKPHMGKRGRSSPQAAAECVAYAQGVERLVPLVRAALVLEPER